MKAISSVLPYVQIFLSVVLIASILLQQTGAAMGGAFGGNDSFSSAHHTRRGLEKTLFMVTIIVGILFAISALLNLVA